MLEIDFVPRAQVVALKFGNLAKKLRSFREPLTKSARQVANPSVAQNFITGIPSWAPLDADTIAKKGGNTILVDSGAGARSASALARWHFDRTEARYDVTTFPATSRYMQYHHFGTDTMPARPFAVLNQGDERQITNVFERWTAEKIRESGLR